MQKRTAERPRLRADMTFRRMAPGDLGRVADIEKVSNPQPWSYDDFEESLAREDGTTLLIVAEEDEAVIGYAVLYMAAGEGEIVTIAVAPDARRRGAGRGLIGALPGFAKAMGVALAEINLEVRISNRPAIGLYEACGFECVGRRPGFYSSPAEDALLMKKLINNSHRGF